MKESKKNWLARTIILALVLGSFIFSSCDGNGEEPKKDSSYKVSVPTALGEQIIVNPKSGAAGTRITVTVNPAAGFVFKEGSLKYNDGSQDTVISKDGNAYAFDLPAANVTVSAVFEPVPAGTYTVTIAPIPNGTITANPQSGTAGATITLTVTPAAGYILKADSLKYNNGTADVAITGYTFGLPAAHVTVSAVFEQAESADALLESGEESLFNGDIDGAIAYFNAAYNAFPNNEKAIVYASLAELVGIPVSTEFRNLVSNRFGITNYPGTINGLISGEWFQDYYERAWYYVDETSGRWLEWYDADQGWTPEGYSVPGYYYYYSEYKLESSEPVYSRIESYYDETDGIWFEWYDANSGWTPNEYTVPGYYSYEDSSYGYIYKLESSTPRYEIIRSYVDETAGTWLQWIDTDNGWTPTGYTVPGYYSYEYGYKLASSTPHYEKGEFLGFEVPEWLKSKDAYKNNIFDVGEQVLYSTALQNVLFFSNLLDKNTNGLNELLDETISAVFGEKLNAVEARIGSLGDRTITVSADTLAAFGLDQIFEGKGVSIGKAEISLVLASLQVVKASLEFLQAYDWSTDLSFLKTNAWDETLLDKIPTTSLPLKSNFLKARNGGAALTTAKADYIKAIDTVVAAYDTITGNSRTYPQAAIDQIKEFEWVKAGLGALKDSINTGTTFYVKESSGTAYANNDTNSLFSINMGKLFTAGQLSLDKLIITESGNAAIPQFYGYKNGSLTAITSKAQFKDYDAVYFKLHLDNVQEIVGGLIPNDANEQLLFGFASEIAEKLYDIYHK